MGSSPDTAWLVDTASLAMLDMLHTLLHMSELELDKPRMCPSPSPSRERLDTTLKPRPSELTLLPLLSTPTPSMELVTLVWLDMVLPTVSSDTLLPTLPLLFMLPLWFTMLPLLFMLPLWFTMLPLLSTPPLLTTPLSTLLPTLLPTLSPRCTPMRSPPTLTTTPSLMTTPTPTSTLTRAATVPATLRVPTLLPFPTAGSST